MRTLLVLVALGMGLGCSNTESQPRPDAGSADTPTDTAAAADEISAGADRAPVHCSADAVDSADPAVVVTDWAQVQRYNCTRDSNGQVVACTRDADCPSGRVCDTSAPCGCCVAPPPVLDSTQALRRALFTACAGGRCAPPSYCTPTGDDRTCTMTFNGQIAVWAMRYQSPAQTCALDDTRRQLCIKAESTQSCLWILELPASTYNADAPFPLDYSDTYECGGRTCNGADTFRIHPHSGITFTAHLSVDNCS